MFLSVTSIIGSVGKLIHLSVIAIFGFVGKPILFERYYSF
jgi:hypothetical protein